MCFRLRPQPGGTIPQKLNSFLLQVHSKNKWGSEGPLKVLQFVPNTGPYLVLRGTPVEGASKDPPAMVL